jgi:peptidoglycan/LPS O-acetylase OafA/YrhL
MNSLSHDERPPDASTPATVPPARAYPDRKIESLESIRGIAALLVVLHHIPDWNAVIHDVRFLRNGYVLVDLFFVLSGFVIYKAYVDKLGTVAQLIRFQFLRFGRLYPVHLLFLMVFVAIEASKYFAQSRYGLAMPNTGPFKESGWSAFVEHVFLLQAIGPTGNALTFNSAAWSISVEFYTYLIFGLTVLFASRFKHLIFAVFVCVSVGLLMARTTFGSTDFVRCIAGFFTGCLTALLSQKSTLRLHSALPGAIFLALIAFLALRSGSELNSFTYVITAALTAALILSLTASTGGWLHALLKLRFLTWLGTISYSVYMSHTAVIWAVNQVFRVLLKRPVLFLDDRMTPQLPVLAAAVSYVVVVVCVLIVSHLSYKFVEEPMRQKSRSMGFPGNFAYRR